MRTMLCWLLLGLIMLPLSVLAEPSRRELESDFTHAHLKDMLELYSEGRRADALEHISLSLEKAQEEFGSSRFYYNRVWKEAQIHSGQADEEWGFDVFFHLLEWEKNHSGRTIPLDELSEREYVLYGNVAATLRSVGRLSDARQLSVSQKNSLLDYHGIDAVRRPYKDLGPLFSFLPDARNRRFPILRKQVFRGASFGSSHISYGKMSALMNVAAASLDVGDWVQAAELYQWFVDYAGDFCLHHFDRRGEASRAAMYAHLALAEICVMHGSPEEAMEEYDFFLFKNRQPDYPRSECFESYTQIKKLLLLMDLNELPEDSIEIASNACDEIDRYVYFSRSTKLNARADLARVHHAMGDQARAWEIIGELTARVKDDVNAHHQMRLLPAMIEMALAEGGKHPGMESWLIRLLQFERAMGRKFKELPLYEQYADFLILSGRLIEAAEILREAVRLSVAMKVPFREQEYSKTLQDLVSSEEFITAVSGSRAKEGDVSTIDADSEDQHATVDADLRQVEIQPQSSRVMIVRDSIAHGRFYVTNPSSLKKSGKLQLYGPISSDDSVEDHHWSIMVDSAAEVKTITRPVTLDPGGVCVVDLKGQGGLDGVETELTCTWLEESVPVSDGLWLYQSSAVAAKRSVIDAHAMKANPFYLIPIHHMIQRSGDSSESDHVDFRIAASQPMRIEVYDETGTTLICVDANGDGDFSDRGDLVHNDLNGNGHPDLTLKDGASLTSFVMYVEIDESDNQKGEKEISISILEDGEWRLDAVDTVE